jgi:transcription-repair coupling factor (superfamily II helicase)
MPRPVGSADALLLAQLGTREKAKQQRVAIITADAVDAQRLQDEMAFFAPDLRCVLFPDWETLPYDSFSPHQDLISERLATLWRISQGDADVVLIPATTALYRLAPPAFLAGYTFHFKVKQALDEAKLKSQLTLAGYTHVTQVVSPGEYAVRGGLIDLFPMGSLVPYRVDLFDNEIDSIRTSTPTANAASTPCPKCACCQAGSSRWTMPRVRCFATVGAKCSMAIRPRAASTKTLATAWPPPVLSTTCLCSLKKPPRCLTTLALRPLWCCMAT